MRPDVAPAPPDGVRPEAVQQAVRRGAEGREAVVAPVHLLEVLGEQAEQAGEVRALPVAVDEGLPEADLAAEERAPEERVAADPQVGRAAAARGAEGAHRAVGKLDAQQPPVEPPVEPEDRPAADALERPGGRGRRPPHRHRARGLRPGEDGQAPLPVQPRRLPDDARDAEPGGERPAGDRAQQGAAGQRPRRRAQAGREDLTPAVPVADDDVELRRRLRDEELVGARAGEEGRDVKHLVGAPGDRVPGRDRPAAGEQVEVHVAEGVSHLDDDAVQPARGVPAEEEARGVEDVAEEAGGRHERRARGGGAAGGREHARELFGDRLASRLEVVAVVDGHGPPPVVAEERERAVELRQLREVEPVEVQRVAEPVAHGVGARVHQLAAVDDRLHSSSPSPRAASTAERTASSWKP